MAIVAIIVSVISASYYLKIIRVLHSTPTTQSDLEVSGLTSHPYGITSPAIRTPYQPTDPTVRGDAGDGGEEFKQINKSNFNNSACGESIITSSHSFLISTLTLSILLFVLKPSILLNSTQLLSLSLFYY